MHAWLHVNNFNKTRISAKKESNIIHFRRFPLTIFNIVYELFRLDLATNALQI